MADANTPLVSTFAQGIQQTNSITTDRGLLNQNVNKLSTTVSSGSDAAVQALNALAAAINALPSN